ncbi:MAG: Lrp/AsnC ligand binding domain-containing protein [Bacteroidetes bacterium]|nr:Lrp/AsnC ligand binding domain-containing protein [Bacteroidota bacterium]MCH8231450.1 Lrp/AsnC ligand binding domain-containing protein [Bacteroidota bacterium]
MVKNYEIDNVDLAILNILTLDAKKAYTDVARKVHVSGGTVHVRMNKMEQAGIVNGSTLILDFAKLGYGLTAFLGIYLSKSSLYDEVFINLKEIKEIVSLHYTTGNYSMFIKLLCKDTGHLKDILHDKIQKIDGIVRTETIISLEESLHRNVTL